MSVNEKMTAIADAIRDKTGETDALTLDDMAADVEKVYDTGKTDMKRVWWDCITNNNTRSTYDYVFHTATFKLLEGGFDPPYVLKPQYATFCFADCRGLTKIKKEHFDWSNLVSANYMFTNCYELEEVEEFEIGNNNLWLFAHCTKLHTIGKFILRDGCSFQSSAHPFIECYSLENIVVEGVISKSVSFQWCSKLTVASIENIISVLSDDATGQTITFNTAVKTTYYNAHSSEYADADEAWDALCATKPNWTIALV